MKALLIAAAFSMIFVVGCRSKPAAGPPSEKGQKAAPRATEAQPPASIPSAAEESEGYVPLEELGPAPPGAKARGIQQPGEPGPGPAGAGGNAVSGPGSRARTGGGILSAPERSRGETRETLLKELNNAVVLYRNDVGSYPARLADTTAPEGKGPAGYGGPYTTPETQGDCVPLPCDPVTGKPFIYDPRTGTISVPEEESVM